MLRKSPQKCPFCNQLIDEELSSHILSTHDNLVDQTSKFKELEIKRIRVLETFNDMRNKLLFYLNRHTSKVQPLLDTAHSLEDLKKILVPKQELYFSRLNNVLTDLVPGREKIEKDYNEIIDSLSILTNSIENSSENLDFIKPFREGLIKIISDIRDYQQIISDRAQIIIDVDQVLQHELDVIAGTEDISLLIDLFDNLTEISKKIKIESIIVNLKDLKKITDNYVATKMLSAITGELSTEVMNWYRKIKTTGDPDVHFDGFDMERTQKGEIKARRVKIKAKSYGEELVSAVSSLSESKLNALGLCVSIATNLKGQSPFEFLIIDDPIQSLDTQHEVQFVQVIRALVEQSNKQVIVLSHNRQWLQQVCTGCRSLNGFFYEITGYTQEGPHISFLTWEKWQDRLDVVNAILQDPSAGTIKLQQAEEEIQIVIGELTSELYRKKKGISKSPHNLNSSQVEKMLIECGEDMGFVNRIVQTFDTTDDSHHAPSKYCPDRERIRQYHSWTHELAKKLK